MADILRYEIKLTISDKESSNKTIHKTTKRSKQDI